MTISQRAQDVRTRFRQAKVGDLVSSDYLAEIVSLTNEDPQAVQSDTITVTGATAAKTYTVTINGIDVSYTAGGSPSTTTIAAGLADAINAEPRVRGQVSASAAVAVVTLVGLWPGIAYTLTESDAELTLASVTTAASADAIPFGVLLIGDGYATDVNGEQEAYGNCKLPKATSFSAQVDTFVTTYVLDAEIQIEIELDGVKYHAATTSAADLATTLTALAAAINGVMPANTVLADGSSGTDLTLTAEVPGATFTTGYGSDDGGASIPVMSLTSNKGIATSLAMAAVGISLYTSDEELTAVAGTSIVYPANAGVRVCRKSSPEGIWVSNAQAPSDGDPVYVETAVGATTGQLYNTTSATRVLLPSASWRRSARPSSGDSLAAVKIAL